MRLQRFFAASLIPLTTLLIFLLLFENRVVLPVWLQVAGRMHPLLLHFPLVLLVVYCIWVLFIPKRSIESETRKIVSDWLLLLSAFSAVVTALVGLFLSREPGYDAEALSWHKWGGVIVSLLSVLWYYFRSAINNSRISASLASAVSFIAILITGHQGAGITHGQNFLLAPLLPEKQEKFVPIEEAIVFANLVQPIFEEKCLSCHNSSKAKGQLVMETRELLLKGGKTGVLWDTTETDLGLLMRRVHLPLEQKKHMPPQGKPQLTDEEMQILHYWIKSGADFERKVLDLPVTDTLRLLAEAKLVKAEVASYDFDAADSRTIAALNNSNRVLTPLAFESPALVVNFYNKDFFNSAELKGLLKVKDQVVSLDCSFMPLKDEDLSTIAQLSNLRTLLINFTPITGKTIGELKKLKHLKSLSVSGTKINKDHLSTIESFPSLEKISLWSTNLSPNELDALKVKKSKIKFETGARTDTMVMKLNGPIFDNEELVFVNPVPLKLKHYINGVEIRYSLDGSEPDSLNSPVYSRNTLIEKNAIIKAKAFKPGWISSDVSSKFFFRSTYLPDSVILESPPEPRYNFGPKVLFDKYKGDLAGLDGQFLGYQKNNMVVLLLFNEAVNAQNITISALKNISPYIMPPVSVEVWGGDSPSNLKLLGKVKPAPASKGDLPEIIPVEVNFSPSMYKCFKVIAVPVGKMPDWHPGKGDKGWVFVDEILVN